MVKNVQPRAKKGEDLPSKVIKLMRKKEDWINMESQLQYLLLGFHHDTTGLLYVEDIQKLACYPKKVFRPDYIWTDINLTKTSTFSQLPFTLGQDHEDKTEYVLRRGKCNGVKVRPYKIKIIDLSPKNV